MTLNLTANEHQLELIDFCEMKKKLYMVVATKIWPYIDFICVYYINLNFWFVCACRLESLSPNLNSIHSAFDHRYTSLIALLFSRGRIISAPHQRSIFAADRLRRPPLSFISWEQQRVGQYPPLIILSAPGNVIPMPPRDLAARFSFSFVGKHTQRSRFCSYFFIRPAQYTLESEERNLIPRWLMLLYYCRLLIWIPDPI